MFSNFKTGTRPIAGFVMVDAVCEVLDVNRVLAAQDPGTLASASEHQAAVVA